MLALLFALSAALPARAAATPPPTDLVIVFDTSGSMNDQAGGGGRRIDVAKAAMWKFIDALPANTNIGLVTFNDGCAVKTVFPPKPDSPAHRAAVKKAVSELSPKGSTPLGASIALAAKLLGADPKRKRRLVVLTDGEDTCDSDLLASASDEAWKDKIRLYAVGFTLGSEPSANFRRMGIYKNAGDPAQLAEVFTDIKRSLERGDAAFDEGKSAGAERPPVNLAGRNGRFKASGSDRAGRLYTSLEFKSSYEGRFGPVDRFSVLENGYHVMFDARDFRLETLEVARVRVEPRPDSLYGGVEGFVVVSDVALDN